MIVLFKTHYVQAGCIVRDTQLYKQAEEPRYSLIRLKFEPC